MKPRKAAGNISWFYWAIITLALVGLVFLLVVNTGVGNKIKSLLFSSMDSWFG